MKHILVLFPKDWDIDELEQPRYRKRYTFYYEGFDLFSFPQNLKLATFNARRYAEKLATKYRGRIDGVISNNEQFGALIAAVVAKLLGLPGTDPPWTEAESPWCSHSCCIPQRCNRFARKSKQGPTTIGPHVGLRAKSGLREASGGRLLTPSAL